MPDEQLKVDTPFVQDAILTVLQQYYKLAQGGALNKQHLIQDDSLRTIIGDFGTADMAPQVALYICKILIVLTDNRRHAAQMAARGYVPIVGRLSERSMPPRLLAKYIQVQSRLMQAEQQAADGATGDKPDAEKPAAQRQRRSKELTFVLPMCNEFQQAAISQQVLKVRGCLSVSFRTCANKHETLAFVRCRADVEPKQLADSIMAVGFEDVGYVLRTDGGNSEEVFTFYRDENAAQPAADLPQYLDDNIEVFDPTTALTTPDFQPGGPAAGGWLNSAKSLFSFW